MIIVKIELHSAVTGQIFEIGRMRICNTGGTRTRGDYSIELMRRGTTDKVLKRAEVKNHARLSYSVWVLVAKALLALGFKIGRGAPETTADPANVDALCREGPRGDS